MEETRTKVDDAGGLFIPVDYQKMLNIKPGDEVIMKLVSGEIRIAPTKQAVQRAQRLVRKYVPPGGKLSDALISERREASEHE